MSQKIGFWSVFALVIGSQIGSWIFLLPAALAPYGLLGLQGLALTALGALTIALVFGQLCSWMPKTGGPHVYINQAFGPTAAFFTGWTYWVISWVGSTAVVIASISYLMPILNMQDPASALLLQIALLLILTCLNFFGVQTAGRVEFCLATLKIASLLLIPLLCISHSSITNFVMDAAIADLSVSEILSRVALLSLWGFIGIESATASADSVKNPARTIPLAIIMGTLCTALLYLLNSFSIMSVLSGNELANSAAPYTTVIKYILGGQWHLIIAVIASVICISSLNVWILISGQIALGLAQDGLLPAWFGKKNSYNAPVWALCLSCLGIFQLLIFSAQKNVSQQIEMLIGYSVTPFLFIYAFSCLAFFKLLLKGTKPLNIKLIHLMYGIPAFVFCCWVITKTSTENITAAAFFAISGLPFYFYYVAKNSK